MVRTLLSEVFRYNIPKGLISANFAKDVIPKRRPRDRAYANRPWTIEERDTVLGKAKPHVRVALALMMNTGLDPSDALRLRNDQVDDGTIWGVRGKTGEEVAIPVSPTLQRRVDHVDRRIAYRIKEICTLAVVASGLHGSELSPENEAPARESFREVLLLERLDESLRRLNPDLPDDAIRAALNKVRDTEFAGDLMSENRRIHEVLVAGVPVSWFEGGTERSDIARLVDWENRENDWLT